MKKNVLIIETNTETVLFYKKLLLSEGFEVQDVASCNQLLNYEFDIPDLFIISSRFLTLNAVEICQHLRNNSTIKNIPIVIISGILEIETLAMHCGAAAFVEKPFTTDKFIATIRQCLEDTGKSSI